MSNPLDTILKRFELFAQHKPAEIYNLYAKDSEFRKFFPAINDYVEQFEEISSRTLPLKIEIINYQKKGSLASVLFIEKFLSAEEGEIIYYTRTILKKTDIMWQIVKETREKSATKRGE